MPPTRENKIIKWLSDIDNDINQIYNIFNYKLISFDIEDKYSRG